MEWRVYKKTIEFPTKMVLLEEYYAGFFYGEG
jgi:hypothetical protein